jgi:integrase
VSVEKVTRKSGAVVWRVRWREGGQNRSHVCGTQKEARAYDAEITRRKRLGTLAELDAGRETLDDFVTATWGPFYAAHLARSTRDKSAALYGKHVGPRLGGIPLRDLTTDVLSRWFADLERVGAGYEARRRALRLVGSILQRAVEHGRLPANPTRHVAKGKRRRPPAVRPLAPVTVEAMRLGLEPRDATLFSVLAYAGLRPGEALALRWEDVRERTLLIERALTYGEIKPTKNEQTRTVRLLAPLAQDLAEWRMRCGRPADGRLVFPGSGGAPWSRWDPQNWRVRVFGPALEAAGVGHKRPYDLRHSFASLLLAEGRSVHYVARQLGHAASMTLDTYGHVIDEFEDAPRIDPETEIRAAREAAASTRLVPFDRSAV